MRLTSGKGNHVWDTWEHVRLEKTESNLGKMWLADFYLAEYPPEWREYVSGWGAAVVNIMVTFPINKTMFRQMVHGFSMTEALRQLKREGALNLYRGILPPLLQKSSSSAIMFGTYSHYSRLIADLLGLKSNQVRKKN